MIDDGVLMGNEDWLVGWKIESSRPLGNWSWLVVALVLFGSGKCRNDGVFVVHNKA